jgi:hypothetical protein
MCLAIAEILAARAASDGGFTWRTSDGRYPDKGFAVAVAKGPERIFDHAITADDIEGFMDEHHDVIRAGNAVFNGGVCIGAWESGGRWYLDLSIVCRSLDEALVLGRQNRQLAVYDLEGRSDIAIPYYAPPEEIAA